MAALVGHGSSALVRLARAGSISFFNYNGDNITPSQEREGYVHPRGDKSDQPVVGDVFVLEFVPYDSGTLPSRYQAVVKVVGIRRIMLGPLKALTPGAPPDPFVVRLSSITVTYNREGTLFRFEGRGVQCGREWAIARPHRIMRFERRRDFRMLMQTPTAYRIDGDEADKRYPARIVNLSAGGVLLVTRTSLTPGQRILVIVPVGKQPIPTYLAVDVIDSFNRPEPERIGFHARARFATGGSQAVGSETREGIMQYIFEQQRLMLRARKLTG
ncbi:MAG TPA: PilZ domain-containing protein [Capsulimonadaceae bacterium]